MKITLDISMYPLQETYKDEILAFLNHLHANKGLAIRVNALSTQIQGEMSEVFSAVQSAVAEYFEAEKRASFVMKLLPGDIALDYEYSLEAH